MLTRFIEPDAEPNSCGLCREGRRARKTERSCGAGGADCGPADGLSDRPPEALCRRVRFARKFRRRVRIAPECIIFVRISCGPDAEPHGVRPLRMPPDAGGGA